MFELLVLNLSRVSISEISKMSNTSDIKFVEPVAVETFRMFISVRRFNFKFGPLASSDTRSEGYVSNSVRE